MARVVIAIFDHIVTVEYKCENNTLHKLAILLLRKCPTPVRVSTLNLPLEAIILPIFQFKTRHFPIIRCKRKRCVYNG